MAIIIPPPKKTDFRPKEKKDTRLIIYFRKEVDTKDPNGYKLFLETVKKANALGLFDEIFIVKGKDIEEVETFQREYQLAALNEMKYLKRENQVLKTVVVQLIRIVRDLRNRVEKMIEEREVRSPP